MKKLLIAVCILFMGCVDTNRPGTMQAGFVSAWAEKSKIAYLRGKRYENEKKIVTNEKGANQFEVMGKNYPQPKARSSEDIASEYGVSEKTIKVFVTEEISRGIR